ncbi:MAG: hypothetical protein Q7T08_06185 [Devosia sp.]|nr:hypothetical protein [Devosia sp.]
MSLAGPDALRSLEEALRDIRREEDEIARRLSRSTELIEKLREQEGDLLLQLAAGRFNPADETALAAALDEAGYKAREVLKGHSDDLAAVETRLLSLDAEIARANSDRAALRAEAETHRAELDALAARVRPDLVKDSRYVAQLTKADELASIAEESLRKTAQADADREHRGRPYRDDPLFMYLWDAGYGTRNYRANSLVAFLDGGVAALVGFARARPNFSMLNEIPLRLREHAVRQEELAEAARGELLAIETAAIDAAGGRASRDALARSLAGIEAADRVVVSWQDQRDEAAKAQRELAQGSDTAFVSAMETLSGLLGRGDLRALLSESRAGAGQDATVIEQIDDVRQRANEEDYETRDHKARLKTLAARRRELEDIQYEFKREGFDHPGAIFDDDRLASERLNDFLRGGIAAAAYWELWRQSRSVASPAGWSIGPGGSGAGMVFSRPRGGRG